MLKKCQIFNFFLEFVTRELFVEKINFYKKRCGPRNKKRKTNLKKRREFQNKTEKIFILKMPQIFYFLEVIELVMERCGSYCEKAKFYKERCESNSKKGKPNVKRYVNSKVRN